VYFERSQFQEKSNWIFQHSKAPADSAMISEALAGKLWHGGKTSHPSYLSNPAPANSF
jgi:hypothetical protein